MTSSFLQPGAACGRSRLPGWPRLLITFAVLLGLKYALPFVGLSAALQVITLLVVATALAWRFWWHCSPDRRGVAVLGCYALAGSPGQTLSNVATNARHPRSDRTVPARARQQSLQSWATQTFRDGSRAVRCRDHRISGNVSHRVLARSQT